MTFDNSVGLSLDFQKSLEEHFRGLLMSGLGVRFDDEPDLFPELLVKYGAMVRGEDFKDEIFPYFPLQFEAWLPDGYSRILRSYVFGPSGFWTMAQLHYAAKFDPFLSLDCARVEGVGAQSKERKGSNFAA